MDPKSQNALAAPKPIELGGKHWYLSPLTPGDFGELWERLRDLAAADVSSPLAAIAGDLEALDPASRAIAIREAVAMKAGAKAVEPMKEAVSARALTIDGVRFNFWLAARQLHPELTLEWVNGNLAEKDRYRIMGRLLEVNGQRADDPKTSGPAS